MHPELKKGLSIMPNPLILLGTPGRIPIDKLRASSHAAYGFEDQDSINRKTS